MAIVVKHMKKADVTGVKRQVRMAYNNSSSRIPASLYSKNSPTFPVTCGSDKSELFVLAINDT